MHRLRDIVGLDHFAAVKLPVGWDQRRVDVSRKDHRNLDAVLAHFFVKRLGEADRAKL
jgi:hypothetical protein